MIYLKIKTSLGDITVELNPEIAPVTVKNFVQYVEDGHYAGTIFHRVIGNFMIQGGGLNQDMEELETRDPIDSEAQNGLHNENYTLAMARTSDPHSATSQFFINTKDNDFLDFSEESPHGWGYTVFGRVVEGFEVVDTIENVDTGNCSFHSDVPVEAVILEEIERLEDYEPQPR